MVVAVAPPRLQATAQAAHCGPFLGHMPKPSTLTSNPSEIGFLALLGNYTKYDILCHQF